MVDAQMKKRDDKTSLQSFTKYGSSVQQLQRLWTAYVAYSHCWTHDKGKGEVCKHPTRGRTDHFDNVLADRQLSTSGPIYKISYDKLRKNLG